MGGEKQRSRLTHATGYSEKAQCTGKPSYLQPISSSMQKPVEGVCLAQFFRAFIKGRGDSNREQQSTASSTKAQKTAHRTPQQHAATVKTQFTKTPRAAFPKKLILPASLCIASENMPFSKVTGKKNN